MHRVSKHGQGVTIIESWKERALTDQFRARALANTETLKRQFVLMMRACIKAGLSLWEIDEAVDAERKVAQLQKPPKKKKRK